MNYVCSRCGNSAAVTIRAEKCDCGGLWQLSYKPPKFDLSLVDTDSWNLFRYRAFMPLTGDGWRDISLGEGMTPIVRLNDDVLLKMDYFMPTLSFKDRGAAVLIAHCKAIGVDAVVQDSSGNAGNSVAAYCAKAGIACEIYVPEGTSPKKINMIKAHNARVVIVPGSRDHCADVCRAAVAQSGRYYANHVYNPFFYQGTKTYMYETYEQLRRIPAHIVIPLGNGTLRAPRPNRGLSDPHVRSRSEIRSLNRQICPIKIIMYTKCRKKERRDSAFFLRPKTSYSTRCS